jgi:hypothetical protein
VPTEGPRPRSKRPARAFAVARCSDRSDREAWLHNPTGRRWPGRAFAVAQRAGRAFARAGRAGRAGRAFAVAGLAVLALGAASSAGLGAPKARCAIPGPRLAGIAAVDERLYVVSAGPRVTISIVDSSCRLTRVATLAVPAPAGLSDVTVAADGALWLGDLDRGPRSAVAVHRWAGGRATQRYELRYPDGPHWAETLLMSYAGELIVVTTDGGVYLAPSPMRTVGVLRKVAALDLRALRASDGAASGAIASAGAASASQQLTGGAVAPDGTHFALRTGTAAYEWETPDGDIVGALRDSPPHRVRLPVGGGITYAGDGRRLLALGAAAPATLHELAIVRAPADRPADARRLPVLAGAAAVLLLGSGVLVLGRQRRRAARTVTTYQSFG